MEIPDQSTSVSIETESFSTLLANGGTEKAVV